MKHTTLKLILPLLLLSMLPGHGQSKQELNEANSILWFGLDFSKALFIGKHDFKTPSELKEKYIPAWNQLMLSEAEKYNISEFFHKPEVETDFGDTYGRNEQIDAEKLIVGIDGMRYGLNEQKVQEIIGEYITDYEGYGLVFVVESFNKVSEKAAVWVTFFHIPTKQVIHTEKMYAEPQGFGLRNYWAGAIYSIMKQCDDEVYRWF